MSAEQDLPTLNTDLNQLGPQPTLEEFLWWARSVGCYPITDGYERYLKFRESRSSS